MRKHQQKQILQLLKTIEQAQTAGFYADCQAGAVSIGNFIESIEGEGTETVALLEEYCELLFKADKGEIKEKQLRRHLIKIENSVMVEFKPNRIEMVFLLYKASMSDSLESIYLAAKSDPDCDAYWIPMPYFELNADGSLGTMYYEGPDYYGENIMCEDWREYHIEARHPDVIFTHYAYDDNVTNASIHPEFYSKRICKHCELLVHVPYFISVSGTVEEYCGYLPGVLYADHVIVESEAVRQSYIGHYKKFDKVYGCKGRFGKAEKKFIVLGSPKFDKISCLKREDCELPLEWRRLVYRSDGSRKKVILYNTHMFAWITSGATYFEKLRSVFDSFRNRDDVVLWWRPHPNTELNFRTKRPEWLDEYKRIISEYKSTKLSIYDTTCDLHRAIAWSDAYYGDWSSLVSIYQCTGKPIMIQNISMNQNDDDLSSLLFESIYDDGENFWFTSYIFNALFKMDKQTWKAEYMGSFPDEKLNGFRLYGAITENNGKLYFAPLSASEMAEYDMAAATFRKIKFDFSSLSNGNDNDTDIQNVFESYDIVAYKNYIYLLPLRGTAIIRYDTETDSMDCFSDWVEDFRKYTTVDDGIYFKMVCVSGSDIVMASGSGNAVVVFNMDRCTSSVFEVGQKNNCYIGVCFDGSNYWLAPRHSGKIVKWNSKSKNWQEFGEFPEEFSCCEISFWGICYCDGYVWLFPNRANKVLKLNIADGSISVAEEIQQECEAEPLFLQESCILSKTIDHMIYTHTGKDNHFIAYNCKTGEKRVERIALPEEAKELYQRVTDLWLEKNIDACKSINDCVFYDNPFTPLNAYLHQLTQNCESENAKALSEKQIEIHKSIHAHFEGTSGAAIYARCKREIMSGS